MIKPIFLTIIFGAFITGFTACEKQIVTENKMVEITNLDKESHKESEEETIGEAHNRLLDVYFNALEIYITANGVNAITPTVVKSIMESNVFIPHFSNELSAHELDLLRDQFSDILDETSVNTADLVNGSNYSEEFKAEVMDLLNDLSNPEISTLNEKNDFCGDWILRIDANENLQGSDEKQVLLDAIDIFDHSYDYWTENLEKWSELIDPNGTAPIPDASNIAGADVAGGIVGAIGGAMLGGVGAGPGAFGGAVLGSVGQAIVNFWDWLGW